MTDKSAGQASPAKIYTDSLPMLTEADEAYRKRVQEIVGPVAGEHYVTSRVKAARSLIRKLSKTPGVIREWESITDKVGVRVVCSTKRDCKAARRALEAFGWVSCVTEVKSGDVDRLFYAGTHVTVDDGVSKDAVGGPILCEVQIRTRSQDAWSVVSHKLLYKGLIRPPRRITRVIHRLTAVVEIFDDEVQRMFKKRESLPAYELARAVEYLDDQYEALLSEPGGAPTDLDIITILWDAYAEDEKPRFVELIESYLKEATGLATQLRAHQPGADSYIDSRDWLSTQPEVLAVLERATHRESLLVDAIRDTDLEDIVRKTCDSFNIVLAE